MFGDRLQNLRRTCRLSQAMLAAKLGVTKQAVSNWENNNAIPSVDMLVKITHFFSVSTDFLLGLEQEKSHK